MIQIACGCTKQGPGSTCERGKRLFATATQAFQSLGEGAKAIAADERWAAYTIAYLAYQDHLRGWWEGDVKVQRHMGTWMISLRSCGRWIVHFGIQDESLIHEWLHIRGYQQLVGMGREAKDHLSGYYRKGDEHVHVGQMPSLLSKEGSAGLNRGGKHTGGLAKDEGLSAPPSRVDLKTQMAISIALLVARIPHSPTLVEQLLVQRRAANLLRTRGRQIGPQDEQTLRELIEEAVQQKERLSLNT
jgi:hypothetical protein